MLEGMVDRALCVCDETMVSLIDVEEVLEGDMVCGGMKERRRDDGVRPSHKKRAGKRVLIFLSWSFFPFFFFLKLHLISYRGCDGFRG